MSKVYSFHMISLKAGEWSGLQAVHTGGDRVLDEAGRAGRDDHAAAQR